jgi:hypothetical protein
MYCTTGRPLSSLHCQAIQDETDQVLLAAADIHQKILEAGLKMDDTVVVWQVVAHNGSGVITVAYTRPLLLSSWTPHARAHHAQIYALLFGI